MKTCNRCKQKLEVSNFAKVDNGSIRTICKSCTKRKIIYFTHPESFYNLFVGKESWKHLYFSKTIGKQW